MLRQGAAKEKSYSNNFNLINTGTPLITESGLITVEYVSLATTE